MGNFTKGDMVLELRHVVPRWGVFWNTGSGEPGNSFILNIDVDKWCFEIRVEASPGSKSGRGESESFLHKGGSPGCGWSLLHEGQGKGDLLLVPIIEGIIDHEVELDWSYPGTSLTGWSIKVIRSSKMKFRHLRGHYRGDCCCWLVVHDYMRWQRSVVVKGWGLGLVFKVKTLVKVLRKIHYQVFFFWISVFWVLFKVFLSYLLRYWWFKSWVFFFRGVLFWRQSFCIWNGGQWKFPLWIELGLLLWLNLIKLRSMNSNSRY